MLAKHEPAARNFGYNGRLDTMNNREAMTYKRKNAFARYNPVSLGLSGAMLFYQHVLSPQISAECLYQRTCSNFGKASIREFGLLRGILLTADRLTRCTTTVLPEVPEWKADAHDHVIDEPWHYKK